MQEENKNLAISNSGENNLNSNLLNQEVNANATSSSLNNPYGSGMGYVGGFGGGMEE